MISETHLELIQYNLKYFTSVKWHFWKGENGLHIASNQIIQVLFYRNIIVFFELSLVLVSWVVRSAEMWDIIQAAIPSTVITGVFSVCAVLANRNLPEWLVLRSNSPF